MTDIPQLLADHIDEDELARQLDRSRRTIKRWRHFRIGPPYTEIGGTVYYNVESFREWLKSREVKPVRALVRKTRKTRSVTAAAGSIR
jgi:hypothetical protein